MAHTHRDVFPAGGQEPPNPLKGTTQKPQAYAIGFCFFTLTTMQLTLYTKFKPLSSVDKFI